MYSCLIQTPLYINVTVTKYTLYTQAAGRSSRAYRSKSRGSASKDHFTDSSCKGKQSMCMIDFGECFLHIKMIYDDLCIKLGF